MPMVATDEFFFRACARDAFVTGVARTPGLLSASATQSCVLLMGSFLQHRPRIKCQAHKTEKNSIAEPNN
jgi:hypothetical protein